MAERDRLGGECAHYGCDPTKAMLRAARVAATARRAGGDATGELQFTPGPRRSGRPSARWLGSTEHPFDHTPPWPGPPCKPGAVTAGVGIMERT